ncbi:tetratricopeptide repeat protein [Ereboglobus luteus]|uniref:Uncharacterized protein n=1 Tax=Ereboglobus luteus TaxID=1796921 RepID=A0A2U8E465_9BACT|nr:tetratricopeptide repeat protein [Ereboglobus luteus]AWI09707.1 hypothetical protein CKA38_10990 [Ereboglobus luteus]
MPFIFDDLFSIPYNESIRSLGTAFSPPNTNGETVSGRPLVNFTLALNYAISGNHVWSYHVVNLFIHVCAGLALFGLVRRTLLLPSMRERFGRDSLPIASAIAALWMLHPMQTESVTYIVQRAESLMGLFYLLTLYCFVRGASVVTQTAKSASVQTGKLGSLRYVGWLALSLLCCLLGMASKEVMVSAPLVVFFYDRAFVSGSFRKAWAGRRAYYLLLASTWILTAWLALRTGSRGMTAGFNTEVSVWTYLLTQCQAIPHYLRLVFWPSGLVFDYGTPLVTSLGEVWLRGLFIIVLLGATVWACVRKPKLGFLGIVFFAVLAPTSSFIPVATQTIATHRMYLPLAALAVLASMGVWKLGGRKAVQVFAVIAIALGALTFHRNLAYQSNLAIWSDTLAKLPEKDRARASNNLAHALIDDGRAAEAIALCVEAVRLKPDFTQAYNNHGYALAKLGRFNDALLYYDKALSFGQNGMDVTLNNRGYALYNLGRYEDAMRDYRGALKLRPSYAEALSNYGNVLCAIGRYDEAMRQLDEALRMDPEFAAAWNNRGNIFAAMGNNPDEALRCYKKAAELDPSLALAIDNVARYAVFLGRSEEALPYFEVHARLKPADALVRQGWGNALMLLGRSAESIPHFERALELDPALFVSRHNLAIALVETGRPADAITHFEKALALQPRSAPLHHNYAEALAKVGRIDEAIDREREALRIQPDFVWAKEQLDALLEQRRRASSVAHFTQP